MTATPYRLWILVMGSLLIPMVASAQTIIESDKRSGFYTEISPGIAYFNFSGRQAESGFVVDLSPPYRPVTPSTEVMPPVPRGGNAIGWIPTYAQDPWRAQADRRERTEPARPRE